MSLVRLQTVSSTTSAKFWRLDAVMDLSRCRVFFCKDRLSFSPNRQNLERLAGLDEGRG